MARPLRLQLAGGIYHVGTRGNAGMAIFRDEADRRTFLGLLSDVVSARRWTCLAYCLMGTHYHLLVRTQEADLSDGMRDLNGGFVRRRHRRDQTFGHLFQGRFFSVLVQNDAHLLHVARYIALNPVTAGYCVRAEEWPWSSHATTCLGRATSVCDPGGLLELFVNETDPAAAYRRFVDGDDHGPYAADDTGRFGSLGFASEHLPSERPREVPLRFVTEREPRLSVLLGTEPTPADMAAAHLEHGCSIRAIARHVGLHHTTVGRWIRAQQVATDSPP